MIDIIRIRPYSDNVLVRLDQHAHAREEAKTAGGIIIPRTAEPENVTATVISAGPGAYDDSIVHTEKSEHRSGKRSVGSSRFCPMDPAIVPGARVLLAHDWCGERVWSDEGYEYRMVRAGVKSQAGDIVGVVT